MNEDKEKAPSIHVDGDWKEQVKQEKEKLKSEQAEPQSESGPADQAVPENEQIFTLLITSIASQAFMALGQIPDPETKAPVVRPDLAKHFIDTLGMLQEKTKGNLTADEDKMLEGIVHELRMIFVQVQPKASDTK